MEKLIDLHSHSTASDGTDSPTELVSGAASAGLAALAVTDHDTVSGLDEACAAGKAYGVKVIRGCELAAVTPYGEVHLLGLWLPPNPARLERTLALVRDGREDRNREMVERFRNAGYAITYDEFLSLVGGETAARPHMARLLVAKGICKSPREAFERFLAEGKPMFVPRTLPTPEEAVAVLKEEGATVVFAHPMLVKAPLDWLESLVKNLADTGLDAIEAYHAEHDAKAVRRAESIARRYKLALSGGSDYHGGARPDVALGKGKGNLRIPYALLEALLERRAALGEPRYP